MAVLRLSGFLGENRAVDPMLLPEGVGTASRNCRPGRGTLLPWKQPVAVASVPGGRNTIYRMGRDVDSDSAYWLSWSDVVHAVRGFEKDNSTERTYFTGSGNPKVTDNIMGLAFAPYPSSSRPLGLPAPQTAPTVTATGGTGDEATYFYVYTFVNNWGWESGPSPVSLPLSRKADAVTTITDFSAVPSGNYSITAIRIYRTQAAADRSASFFYVGEVAAGSLTATDANGGLGEVLPTATWLPPPDDLACLTPLWNGMMAGISGGAVRFCEAYTPYAWPIEYEILPPDSSAVALGVFGQSLLVLTTGRPLLVSGSGPDAMDQLRLEIPQACVAPRSVVSMGTGVAWASNDGLCFFGSSGPAIVTSGVMLREDWLALRPETIIGQMYEGLYFGSYDDGSPGGRKGFVINPASPQGIFFMDVGYAAMHFDELQDQLYVLNSTSVQRWDSGAPMTARHRGKLERLPHPVAPFSCAKVIAHAYPVTFRLWADGVLRHTQVVTSRAPFRLPAGYRAADWQMELAGSWGAPGAAGAVMAHSMKELAQS